MVALSHYCCRTTLQCQKTLPKQHSFQFLTEGDQSRRIPDMSRQRVPGSCCSRRKSAVAQC